MTPEESMKRKWIVSAAITFALAACGDDGPETTPTNPPGTGATGGSTEPDPVPPPDDSSTRFQVVIENISDGSSLPGPFAPGTAAVHTGDTPLFSVGAPDAGLGLEQLAEDGGGMALADAVNGLAFGVPITDDTPADGAGPLMPGMRYEFSIDATPGDKLSFATMLVQTNDVFFAPPVAGIALFDDAGEALPERDVTSMVELWDAGTEMNQAPAFGLDQPIRGGSEIGAAEGVISPFNSSTRALPRATQLADVELVDNGDGSYTVTITNTSADARAPMPLGPVFYAVHSADFSLFTVGEPNASPGLEILAEDGDATALANETMGATGVISAGAVPFTSAGAGGPGESTEFTVMPTAVYPYVTFATMAVQSNDVFVAPPASGIAFIDANGEARDLAAIAADIENQLELWDAGTEVNQVPGSGRDQPVQGGLGTGDAEVVDQDAGTGVVRRYRDSTNDLAEAAPLIGVSVAAGPESDELTITIENTSAESNYPTPISPIVWALHDDSFRLVEDGTPASPGIEAVAEDGSPMTLAMELSGAPGVVSNGVMAVPQGATEPGPILPGSGGRYVFTVSPTAEAPYLSFTTMVVATNDAFIDTSAGVSLFDGDGLRTDFDSLAQEIEDMLQVWDAGTEANEPGALGPNQAGNGGEENTGPASGSGVVRAYDDPIWNVPSVDALIRVTVRPEVASEE